MAQTSEGKAFALYSALQSTLGRLEDLVKDTNSEPTFGEYDGVEQARAALFENRPLADWETAL